VSEVKVGGIAPRVQCPWCGYQRMHYSGSKDDPDEVLGDTVRCDSCGHITDYYEAHKKWEATLPDTMTKEQLL